MHAHGHAHHHHDRRGRAFALSVGLNIVFVGAEASYGLISGSMALLADAAHNLGDVLGLILAWVATILARRKRSARRTYGWRRSTVLAALANALLIFGAAGGVAWEAITRLADPPPLHAVPIIIVAGIGVVVNAASAVFFLRDRERDVNIRAAFMHLTADAAVSFGVVLAGLAMLWTQLAWIDPAVSLLIAAAIFLTTWNVFRESLDLALDAVPTHIDVGDVRRHLCGLRGVKQVHDLHVWAMSTDDVALTAHLVVDEPTPDALVLLDEAAKGLRERFGIEHSTLQLEPHSFVACPQESHGPCSVEEHHEHAAAGR